MKTKTARFSVRGTPYEVKWEPSMEVLFYTLSPAYDPFGMGMASHCPCSLENTIGAGEAILVFRHVQRIVLQWIQAHKPTYIWFTANYDAERQSLYERIAHRVEGYQCACTSNMFMLTRIVDMPDDVEAV